MKTAEIIKLKAQLGDAIAEVLDSYRGEYSREDAAGKLAGVITSTVDLNEYAIDIARSLIDAEENLRSVKLPQDDGGQLSIPDVEDKFFSHKAIYKLGDSRRIKTRKAKMPHGMAHQGQLNEKAVQVAQSAQRHNTLLIKCQPYIEKDPKLTLLKAWQMYLADHPLSDD